MNHNNGHNGKPITILIADDDVDDRMLARDALAECRLANDIRFVGDGEELMDYLHQRNLYADPASAPVPGLVLLDLKMPRKDGREALKEIKADARLRRIPVVVLTTSKAEEDIYRTYDLGVNSFVTKPVTFEQLVQSMKTLTKYWIEIVELPPEEETKMRTIQILLADDDPDDRMLLADALAENGSAAELHTVEDGEQLLDYLRRRGAFKKLAGTAPPTLILLDLNMPRKDGREALRELKADPALRRIPVVVLTTSRADDDIRRTYDLGVNSFIIKPSAFADLVEILKTLSAYWFDTVKLPEEAAAK